MNDPYSLYKINLSRVKIRLYNCSVMRVLVKISYRNWKLTQTPWSSLELINNDKVIRF